MKKTLLLAIAIITGVLFSSCKEEPCVQTWYRPATEPVFTTTHGNNHDAIVLVDTLSEYPYKMIVSSWGCKNSTNKEQTFLWRAKEMSWNSNNWQLVNSNYNIGCQYEYDDAVLVNGKYFLYEDGIVYTFRGELEDASGKWESEGSFPKEVCDDVGVYYEDGTFHLFGEYGSYPHGPDGTSLAHLISKTGLGDWIMVDSLAVNANPNGGNVYGVGDPSIVKINGVYHLYCDLESKNEPYKVVLWTSPSLDKPFDYQCVAAEARKNASDNWDNHRVQDAEVFYAHELGTYVMACNMKDVDGIPGGDFPGLKNFTRVIGFFYLAN